MAVGLFVVLLNALLAALAFYNFYWKRRNLPPGPTPLPLVGNMPALHAESTGEAQVHRWSRQFGPVFTFWMGEQPVVMVTDYRTIHEAFVRDGDAFAGRVPFCIYDPRVNENGEDFGVIIAEGDVWREHRRFVHQIFREFGVGQNVMQDKILAEIVDRFEKLDRRLATNDGDLDLINVIDVAIGSIVNGILFGHPFNEANEREFFEMKRVAIRILRTTTSVTVQTAGFWPEVLTRLPYFRDRIAQLRADFDFTERFFRRKVGECEGRWANAAEDQPASDYVTAYLKERQRRHANHLNEDPDDDTYSIDRVVFTCMDLWIAGQETTTTTLSWGVAFILHHPDVQRRLHAELDTVIGGPDRLVTTAEKANLPYVNAVINEVQRMGNLLPVNLLHRTTRDVTINGYRLKQGTAIVPQISAVLSDEKYFSDAARFNPSRFLDADGKLIKCDELIPFGVGKRQCLGEALARMELFLFFANLYNRYTKRLAVDRYCPDFCRALRERTGSCLFDPYRSFREEHTIGYSVVNCVTYAKQGNITYLSNDDGETRPNVVCLKGSDPKANYTNPQFLLNEDASDNIFPCDYTTTTTGNAFQHRRKRLSAPKPASDATFPFGSWFGTLVAAVLSSSAALQWLVVQ